MAGPYDEYSRLQKVLVHLKLSKTLIGSSQSEPLGMTLLHYMSVSPKARRIVIDIFRKLPPNVPGLTTKQIYEQAVNGYNDKTDLRPVPLPTLGTEWRSIKGKHVVAPLPPNPGHPIRSMRYLKKMVLEALVEEGVIVKTSRKHIPEDPKALEKWNTKRASQKAVTEWYWRAKTGEAWEKAKKALEEEETRWKGEGKLKEKVSINAN